MHTLLERVILCAITIASVGCELTCSRSQVVEQATSLPSVDSIPAEQVSAPGGVQGDPSTRPSRVREFCVAQGAPLPWIQVIPPRIDPRVPWVLALHGRGDTPFGFRSLIERLGVALPVAIVEAPLAWRGGRGRQWFDARRQTIDGLGQAVDQVMAFSQWLQAHCPSHTRPILLGFSQGAMVALQAMVQHTEAFSAAVALSGYLLDDTRALPGSPRAPLLLSAGSQDKIISAEKTRHSMQVLTELGYSVEYAAFDGGHQVPPEVLTRIHRFLDAQGFGQ